MSNTQPPLAPRVVNIGKVLELSCPHWFKRDDFVQVLNSGRAATWHTQGELPTDFSDLFVLFDQGDGSNYGTDEPCCLPDDIWEEICRVADVHRFEHGVVWIKPV
jgi:hypothetical protein